jgi:hypothetical protein
MAFKPGQCSTVHSEAAAVVTVSVSAKSPRAIRFGFGAARGLQLLRSRGRRLRVARSRLADGLRLAGLRPGLSATRKPLSESDSDARRDNPDPVKQGRDLFTALGELTLRATLNRELGPSQRHRTAARPAGNSVTITIGRETLLQRSYYRPTAIRVRRFHPPLSPSQLSNRRPDDSDGPAQGNQSCPVRSENYATIQKYLCFCYDVLCS